ncbi:MAG: DUF1109 family protein [Alphaproteobacteria bacterium]|nr:DUF1109 family protein [Alphaproteobacteria bacterium]
MTDSPPIPPSGSSPPPSGQKQSEDLPPQLEGMINGLCQGLKPCCGFHTTRRALLWILLLITYTTAIAMTIGLRENIQQSMNRSDYVFELLLAFATGISSALATFWLSTPNSEDYKKYYAVPITLLCVQLLWMFDRLFFEGMGDIRENWFSYCWINTAIHTTLPALAVILLIKKGASVRPCLMACMGVLAVSEFGWIGMRLVCPQDTVGEAYFLNFLPYIILGIVMGFLAKRLFRW